MKKRTRDQTQFTADQLLDVKDIPILKQWYHVLTEKDLTPTTTDPVSDVVLNVETLSLHDSASSSSVQTLQAPT